MHEIFILSLYTVLATIAGFAIPYFFAVKKQIIAIFIAISSGIIFGITIFHLFEHEHNSLFSTHKFALFFGFFLPVLIERISHRNYRNADHGELPFFNWMTFLAFFIHSLIDGIILNTSLVSTHLGHDVVLGIIAHKIPVAFSLMTVLKTHEKKTYLMYIMLLLFGISTSIGALLGFSVLSTSSTEILHSLIDFTAGTLLYISIIHLFYDHDIYKNIKLIAFSLLGFLIAGII
jgi:zinc transporter ZupT